LAKAKCPYFISRENGCRGTEYYINCSKTGNITGVNCKRFSFNNFVDRNKHFKEHCCNDYVNCPMHDAEIWNGN
jgi:hypothetical protein